MPLFLEYLRCRARGHLHVRQMSSFGLRAGDVDVSIFSRPQNLLVDIFQLIAEAAGRRKHAAVCGGYSEFPSNVVSTGTRWRLSEDLALLA